MTEKSRLSRWAERKSRAEKGEALPDDTYENVDALSPGHDHGGPEDDPDPGLTDDELLAQHNLPDPATIDDEDMLGKFLESGVPDRLRQLALRRLWRINPLFGIVDDMVEYGENYTDAATVIEGMQSAYQVGKGYLKKTEETLEKMSGEEESPAEDNPGNESVSDVKTEEVGADQGNSSDHASEDDGVPSHTGDDADEISAKDNQDEENSSLTAKAMHEQGRAPDTENARPDAAVPDSQDKVAEPLEIRPRRQVFRKV
jgi:hypothetical protein